MLIYNDNIVVHFSLGCGPSGGAGHARSSSPKQTQQTCARRPKAIAEEQKARLRSDVKRSSGGGKRDQNQGSDSEDTTEQMHRLRCHIICLTRMESEISLWNKE